jgi:hypothetical protein
MEYACYYFFGTADDNILFLRSYRRARTRKGILHFSADSLYPKTLAVCTSKPINSFFTVLPPSGLL